MTADICEMEANVRETPAKLIPDVVHLEKMKQGYGEQTQLFSKIEQKSITKNSENHRMSFKSAQDLNLNVSSKDNRKILRLKHSRLNETTHIFPRQIHVSVKTEEQKKTS